MNNISPLQNYNYLPTTIDGRQFTSYKQPGFYMTDYRNSSDSYAYLIREASGKGVLTNHQLRQYIQDNGTALMDRFSNTNAMQFLNLENAGAPNTCSGAEEGILYSGGKPLVDTMGHQQMFPNPCGTGGVCVMPWDNTPMAQQGPHCAAPGGYYPSYSLLN